MTVNSFRHNVRKPKEGIIVDSEDIMQACHASSRLGLRGINVRNRAIICIKVSLFRITKLIKSPFTWYPSTCCKQIKRERVCVCVFVLISTTACTCTMLWINRGQVWRREGKLQCIQTEHWIRGESTSPRERNNKTNIGLIKDGSNWSQRCSTSFKRMMCWWWCGGGGKKPLKQVG